MIQRTNPSSVLRPPSKQPGAEIILSCISKNIAVNYPPPVEVGDFLENYVKFIPEISEDHKKRCE